MPQLPYKPYTLTPQHIKYEENWRAVISYSPKHLANQWCQADKTFI